MESLSSYAKRFVAHVAKPDVDFVFGLSPVISIEQKTVANNPRSTVGHDDRHRQLPESAVRDDRPGPLPAHRRAGAEPDGEPDSRSHPGAARGHRDRAARAGVQGLRRGSELRLHRDPEEGLPAAGRRRQGDRHRRRDRARGVRRRAHGRDRRPLRGRPEAREGDPGGHRQHAAGWRRAAAGAGGQGRLEGGGRALLQGAVQPDAPLRLRRHRPRVLHVQQPGERLPDLRRPRRGQAHASGPDRPRCAAQHRRRLLRQGGVPLQPRHVGRDADVQPVEGARLLARHAVEGSARARAARRFSTAPSRRRSGWSRRPTPRTRARSGRAGRSDSTASRAASNAGTAAIASAARPTRGWRRGSTR